MKAFVAIMQRCLASDCVDATLRRDDTATP